MRFEEGRSAPYYFQPAAYLISLSHPSSTQRLRKIEAAEEFGRHGGTEMKCNCPECRHSSPPKKAPAIAP
jgi:hypothetical protein